MAFVGQRGVQLFYLVSAFTIFYTLDRARFEHHPIRNFYLRRFFRIAPLFYIAVLLFVGLTPDKYTVPRLAASLIFIHAYWPTHISNVAPGGWSITVETTFYWMAPFLFARLKTLKSALWTFVAALLVSSIFSALFSHNSREYFQLLWFPAEFPIFLLGIIAYLVYRDLLAHSWQLPDGRHPDRRSLSALLLLMSAATLFLSVNPFASTSEWANIHLVPSCFMFVLLLLGLVLHPWQFFVNRVTRFLGKISYSIYLSHGFISWWLSSWMPLTPLARWFATWPRGGWVCSSALMFASVLALTIPLSMLLWRFVEQPGIRLGRWIIAELEQRAAARPALIPQLSELAVHGNTSDAQF